MLKKKMIFSRRELNILIFLKNPPGTECGPENAKPQQSLQILWKAWIAAWYQTKTQF